MTQREPVGIKSLAVSYPRAIRTNDYFRDKHPDVVAKAEEVSLGKIWAPPQDNAQRADDFDAAAAPYMKDPFRGTIRRRVLSEGESSLTLELEAARRALDAAKMRPEDVQLAIVSSLVGDTIGAGNAAYLAARLGLRGAAWNLETACSSSAVALQTATAMIRAGEYRNVLAVSSCSYSREAPENDTLAWFVGDGAGAFVVAPCAQNEGVLGTKTIHTAETCHAFYYEMAAGPKGNPKLSMRWNPELGRVIRETSITYLRTCCAGALEAAGVALPDIDFFVFNTPTAWYARFCTDALGVDYARTIDTYPLYANIGPALLPTNLYRAAKEGRLRAGDLLLIYTIGSTSTASATVMRWGEVALGPDPEESTT
jgi:3-oxoacyl-[acyl-carrier-protein] synthase III